MIWGAERRACEVAEGFGEWTRVGANLRMRWTLSGPVALFFGLALLSLRGRVKALTVLVLLADVVAFGETLAESGVDPVLWPRGAGMPGRKPTPSAGVDEASLVCGSGPIPSLGRLERSSRDRMTKVRTRRESHCRG